MRVLIISSVAAALFLPGAGSASAQPVTATGPQIVWEVKNRFRLFRHESDFLRHVAADRGDGVLAAERRLASASAGRGWARLMLNGLCLDVAGRVLATCERDNVKESYLAPDDHRIGVRVAEAPADATCGWSFQQIDQPPQQAMVPCHEEVRLRVRYGTPTFATVDVWRADGAGERAQTEILVRDLLIAGLGDSVASGEGNPDQPVVLSDAGFCFRRVLGGAGSEYYRPSRAGFRGARACETAGRDEAAGRDWMRRGAGWMSAACHRSLYSYQVRTALALAIENPHIAVTFLPFACTGAEIVNGLFEARRAREVACSGRSGARTCPSTVPAQIPQAVAALRASRRGQRERVFDLVLLTVGANDIHFSELVAGALLERSPERALMQGSGGIASVEDARSVLRSDLPGAFAQMRAALKALVGGNLARVVYVSYGNPASHQGGAPCPGGRAGVDIHPAFNVNGELVRRATAFVDTEFLPRLKALALCEDGVICKDASDRMSFVDAHQAEFRDRGFCARSDEDPAFDKACFSPDGKSFQESLRAAAERPLVCDVRVKEFRPYASRARWIRTPNDSYFAAMTYPDGLPATMQPADIHDAAWGVLSAVYGGAIHPTAEGHAAMADAALAKVRDVLSLQEPVPTVTRPLLPMPTEGSKD